MSSDYKTASLQEIKDVFTPTKEQWNNYSRPRAKGMAQIVKKSSDDVIDEIVNEK